MTSKPTTHTLPHEQGMRTPPWLYEEMCRLVTTPPAKAGGFKCRLRRLRSVRALEC